MHAMQFTLVCTMTNAEVTYDIKFVHRAEVSNATNISMYTVLVPATDIENDRNLFDHSSIMQQDTHFPMLLAQPERN